jgi:sialate O-acetylesterase
LRRALTIVLIVLGLAGSARAELRLGSVFSDHMVIQQGRPTRLWGWAEAGRAVTIEIAGQKIDCKADARGRWSGEIAALQAGGPHTLIVSAGAQRTKVEDVLVGELWLCSGQSNMAMPIRELPEADAKAEVAAAEFPQIRMVRTPEAPAEEPWDRIDAPSPQWKLCSPENAPGFSAMAYYFGRKIHQARTTPVGLIVCAWGGSAAHAWMSREALNDPLLRRQMPHDVLGWRENVRPNKLFCGMLNPLIGTTIRGVVWYQGESEADPGQNPYLYRLTFPGMIQDWRRQWGEELPFYFVQLPNLRRHERRAVLRESQEQALQLPHTGMIVTTDIGQADHSHPTNKREFGERMADLVLAREYGAGGAVDGPRYKSLLLLGNALAIRFDHADGLKTTDGKPPAEFLIAGADQQFVPAEARIEGNSVIVLSTSIPQPVAVRYTWSGNPKVNLVNSTGLPTPPFRTDEWPVTGQEMMWRSLPPRAGLASITDAKAIVAARADGWRWIGEGIKLDELATRNMARPGEGHVQLIVSERPKDLPMPSPALLWAYGSAAESRGYDPANGFTAELKLQPYRFGAPVHGIELAVALKQVDGSIRRYRIEVSPMRVYGCNDDLTLVLGHNLNNSTAPHVYRIAVRRDGVAQVYFDGQELGVLPGEVLKDAPADTPMISWGKRVTSGHMTVNAHSVAFDAGGAFSPGETTETAEQR